jgi:hypothetical protein
MESKIAAQDEKLDHFVNATKRHDAHFKNANKKVIQIADFLEQTFFAAITIWEKCLMHTV